MKEILIIFTDPHLPYSPTIINLFNELKKHTAVSILVPEPEKLFSLQKVDDPGVVYFKHADKQQVYPGIIKRVVKKMANRISPPSASRVVERQLQTSKTTEIIRRVKEFRGEIIAVDFMALWCAQQADKKAHLVSLEIHTNDRYRDNCSFNEIQSVLIQSEERYSHIFENLELKRYFVQNSPPFLNFVPDFLSRPSNELVFCGSAVAGFGIFSCLDFIRDYPQYKLTIKGAVPPATWDSINRFYNELLTERRLIIDDSYMDAESLTRFISRFRAGFVFYDFYRFEHLRTFNYYTAPSGKMFQYFNSGVPVIGNRLPGLEIIETSNAGFLIPSLGSVQIKGALDKIEASYNSTAENAKNISKCFDFPKMIQSFVDLLKN